MASVAPGLITVPKTNTLEVTIKLLNKQAETYKSASGKLSGNTNPVQEGKLYQNFGELIKEAQNPIDRFNRNLDQKQNSISIERMELNQEKYTRKRDAQKQLLELFFKSIKDGILTDKEKKKILKKLKEYKALKNFLDFSYQTPQIKESPGTLGELIKNSDRRFNKSLELVLRNKTSEMFDIAYAKIENQNIERDNLAAADSKISDSELSDQAEGKAELTEIKALGNMILQAL